MSNLEFVRKLYNGKNCYSDHMSNEELGLIHIGSKVEDIILSLLKSKKIVFLTGNPGDGKTFLIKKHNEEILAFGTYIETDLNRVANYDEVATEIIKRYKDGAPAIVAVNEYQFYQLCKIIKRLSSEIYNEIMRVKKDCIIYDLPSIQLKKIAIVDLNERSLLEKDRDLTGEILDKICNLISAEEIHSKQLKDNLMALSSSEVRGQVIDLINMATMSCEHFAVRDILGAISFMLTACTTDEYADMPYYDAMFESSNSLLQIVKQFDPIYLSKATLDEKLWNGEIRDGWQIKAPGKWPNSQEYDNSVDEAVICFKSVKRKYYFENEGGKELADLQPDEIKRCTDIFTSFEMQKKPIKERIIRSINKLFLPTSEDKKQLRIWTTHRYDYSTDIATAISSRYVDTGELEIKMPRPNDWLEGMEYVPNHIILKPKGKEKPELVLDVDFLRTLDAVENGYPVGLLAPQYEQTAARFLRQLDDNRISDENDDGEIIIASRKKSYKKSIFITENKYSFEEDE